MRSSSSDSASAPSAHGPSRCQAVEALPGQGGEIQQTERGEVDAHRAEVQVFDVHGAHGAKQQRGRQHHEDEVGQVFHSAGANPLLAARHKADGNEKHHGNQGSNDGRIQDSTPEEKKNKDGNNRVSAKTLLIQ